MSTGEGMPGSQVHSRVPSASAIGLPAKPVDAAAAAAAMSSASPKAASQQRASVPGMGLSSPPPHPSRPNPANRVAFPGHPAVAIRTRVHLAGMVDPHRRRPAHLARPLDLQHTALHETTHTVLVVLHQSLTQEDTTTSLRRTLAAAAATSTRSASRTSTGGMHWNTPQAYQPPPLHMTPGSAPTHGLAQYGGYGGQHGGYGGAAAGAQGGHWNNQSYPGSHYPGYGAGGSAQQGHYAPQPHSYGYAGYSNQPASADAYNAYGYSAPATSAAATSAATAAPSAQDSYDPRSPSMSGAVNGSSQNAAAAGAAPQGQGQG